MKTLFITAALLVLLSGPALPTATLASAQGAASGAQVPIGASYSPAARPYTYAVYYSPGVMERVSRVRHLPIVKYMASVPDCSRIGQWVLAQVAGHVRWFRVTDCSAPRDRARHIRNGLVIEVNWAAAREFGFLRAGRAPAHIIRFAR